MTFPPKYPKKFNETVLTPLSLVGQKRSVRSTLTPGLYTMGFTINGVDVQQWAVRDWFDVVGFAPAIETEYVDHNHCILVVFDFRCPIELAYFKLYFGIS